MEHVEVGTRSCGAACLANIYEALDKPTNVSEIWPAIAKENSAGSLASATHLMVRDAIDRGFEAVALQALHPLQALRMCQSNRLGAILNRRISKTSAAGHYSVLTAVEQHDVVLYEPDTNSSRRFTHQELLELWQPGLGKSEITGFVLIAIGQPSFERGRCDVCNQVILGELACPDCSTVLKLAPDVVLGCTAMNCVGRTWSHVLCPYCDKLFDQHGLARNLSRQEQADAAMQKLFVAMDNFTAFASSVPRAVAHAELQSQFSLLASAREKVTEAYSKQRATLTYFQTQTADALRDHYQRLNASRPPAEAPAETQPEPHLNGHELGKALLQSLRIPS